MTSNLPNLKLKNVVVVDDESRRSEKEGGGGEERENDDSSLIEGLSLEKLSLGPKKKLLVLALGGLLVDRVHQKIKFGAPSPKIRPPDVVAGNFRIFKRPFCEEFLKFCLERFEVGLWSSAFERNVDSVLSNITEGLRSKLLFIWDQDECTESQYGCLGKPDKPIFLKELKKIWENNPKWPNGNYSSSNTLLIDNDPYKALLNPPHTAIFPRKYSAKALKDKFLAPNGELQVYLEGLADANDVPTYVREHQFGQESITPSHADWGYYSKVIKDFSKEGESSETS